MKRAIMLFCITCAGIGAGNANAQTVSIGELVERGGVFYQENSEQPYTGRVVSKYVDGQLRLESYYSDGRKDGVETSWYEDGSVRRESGYKDGERHGEWTHWDTNHRPTFHRRYDEGERLY